MVWTDALSLPVIGASSSLRVRCPRTGRRREADVPPSDRTRFHGRRWSLLLLAGDALVRDVAGLQVLLRQLRQLGQELGPLGPTCSIATSTLSVVMAGMMYTGFTFTCCLRAIFSATASPADSSTVP